MTLLINISVCHLVIFWFVNWEWSELLPLWFEQNTKLYKNKTKYKSTPTQGQGKKPEEAEKTWTLRNPVKVSYKTLKSLLYSLRNSWRKQKIGWNTQNTWKTDRCLYWKWANVAVDHIFTLLWSTKSGSWFGFPGSDCMSGYRKRVWEAWLFGWVCGLMGEPQIWGTLMSLFGAQLCVCLWRLKSIRNLLGVRTPLLLQWLCASERPEWPTSTSFSPQNWDCEAIRHHRRDAWRALEHQNMLSNHPQSL